MHGFYVNYEAVSSRRKVFNHIYISIISKKVLFTKYIWPTFDEVEQLFKSSFVWRDLKFVLHIHFSPGQQM